MHHLPAVCPWDRLPCWSPNVLIGLYGANRVYPYGACEVKRNDGIPDPGILQTPNIAVFFFLLVLFLLNEMGMNVEKCQCLSWEGNIFRRR